MSVLTQQLLQPDTGVGLPAHVRRSLIDMGVACNAAVNAVNQAFLQQVQTVTAQDAFRALQQPPGLAEAVTEDLARCADRYHDELVTVFARATTTYAVYAAQVASDVAAGRIPSVPGSQVIHPSDLLTALDLYLPPVTFAPEHGDATVVREQNADIANARKSLVDLITHQLEGHEVMSYDDSLDPSRHVDPYDLIVGLPDALHTLAATLVWAVGVFTGVADDSGGAA